MSQYMNAQIIHQLVGVSLKTSFQCQTEVLKLDLTEKAVLI